CRGRGVPLVVDAAAALGGRLPDGRWAGLQGDLEVFSLHATKVFGVGEGGVILAPPDRVPALRRALNFGLGDGDVAGPGLNGNMSEFHGAVGLAVLRHIERFIARREAVARRYRAALGTPAGVGGPRAVGTPPWQTFPLLAPPGVDAAGVVARARAAGGGVRRRLWAAAPHTIPLPAAPGGACPRAHRPEALLPV